MTSRLLLIALAALLSVSQRANAGVMMFVDFGNQVVNSFSDIQSTFDASASSVTANIYLKLTDTNTSIYGYRFSVRYDPTMLKLDLHPTTSPDDDLNDPTGFKAFRALQDSVRSLPFIRNTSVELFQAPVAKSHIADQFTNDDFVELRRFNGILPGDDSTSDQRFFKVASLTFTNLKTGSLTAGAPAVLAGKFDAFPKDPDPTLFEPDAFIDGIFTEDTIGNTSTIIDYDIQSYGGSVGGSTVPEPSTVVIFAAIGGFVLVLRRRVA